MNAIWLIRSRQLASRLRFWIAIVGYNPRDRSLGHSIYLFYVAIFFSLWGFAVLTLLANFGAGILSILKGAQPETTASMVITVILLGDFILRGYISAKRSPFVFTEDDAGLICQTPVDRRQVAIIWMVSDWLVLALPYAALVVVLCFANIQLIEPGNIQWSHLPGYLLSGLRVTSIVLPIHLAFTSLDNTLGVLRLQGDRDIPSLSLIPIGFAAIFIGLALVYPSGLKLSLLPLQFVIMSGIGEANWLIGFIVGVTFALFGLLMLYMSSPRLNLSRAAHESRFRSILQQVSRPGNLHLNHRMKPREQLGSGHRASRLPGWAGAWSLLWKDWVISLRVVNPRHIGAWLGIFCASLGLMLPLGEGVHLWAFVIWSLFVGQRGTGQLRNDLELWAITRQLPFHARDALLLEIVRPVTGVIFTSWLASGISAWFGYIPDLKVIVMIPTVSLCITLAVGYVILRQAKSTDLLVGQAVDIDAGGVLLGLLIGAVPIGLIAWITSQSNVAWVAWIATVLGFALSSGIAYGMWMISAAQYRKIK